MSNLKPQPKMGNDFSRTGVVIVAGGSGRRMGASLPKQFLLLEGLPVLAHTIRNFARALRGAPIVVVLPADRVDFWRDYAARFEVARHKVVAGGAERFHSVRNGIEALPMDTEWIAVQDGVRPLGSVEMIRRTVLTAQRTGSAVPVVEATDSYRRVLDDGRSEAVDRKPLRQVQTPQVFCAGDLRYAYEQPFDPAFTDDATMVERTGVRITLCQGERTNLKITTREDLVAAAAILEDRRLRDEERRLAEMSEPLPHTAAAVNAGADDSARAADPDNPDGTDGPYEYLGADTPAESAEPRCSCRKCPRR